MQKMTLLLAQIKDKNQYENEIYKKGKDDYDLYIHQKDNLKKELLTVAKPFIDAMNQLQQLDAPERWELNKELASLRRLLHAAEKQIPLLKAKIQQMTKTQKQTTELINDTISALSNFMGQGINPSNTKYHLLLTELCTYLDIPLKQPVDEDTEKKQKGEHSHPIDTSTDLDDTGITTFLSNLSAETQAETLKHQKIKEKETKELELEGKKAAEIYFAIQAEEKREELELQKQKLAEQLSQLEAKSKLLEEQTNRMEETPPHPITKPLQDTIANEKVVLEDPNNTVPDKKSEEYTEPTELNTPQVESGNPEDEGLNNKSPTVQNITDSDDDC